MISNRTRAARSFDFEITRMISDQIALHSVDDLDDETIHSDISSQVSLLECDEDPSKYFGVLASVFHSHLVSRFFHLFYEQSLL